MSCAIQVIHSVIKFAQYFLFSCQAHVDTDNLFLEMFPRDSEHWIFLNNQAIEKIWLVKYKNIKCVKSL